MSSTVMEQEDDHNKPVGQVVAEWKEDLYALFDNPDDKIKKNIKEQLEAVVKDYDENNPEASRKQYDVLKKKLEKAAALENVFAPEQEASAAEKEANSRQSVTEVVDTFRKIGKIHQRNPLGQTVNKHVAQFDVIMATLSLFGVNHDKLDEGISKIITSEGREELKEVASKKIEEISPELKARTEGMIEAIAGLAEKILDSRKMENAMDSFSRFAVKIPVFGDTIEAATDTAREAVGSWTSRVAQERASKQVVRQMQQ